MTQQPLEERSQAGGALLTHRDAWRRRVSLSGPAPFLRCHGQDWTFDEADAQVRSLAAGLRSCGIGLGSVVAAGLDNGPDPIFLHLAVAEVGAVLVALVPGLGFTELAFQVNHSGAELLVLDGRVAAALGPRVSELTGIRFIVTGASGAPDVRSGPAQEARTLDRLRLDPIAPGLPIPGLEPSSPGVVMYTSGSTAHPKGVLLSAHSIVAIGAAYAERFGLGESDTFLLPFTVAHGVGGLVVPGMMLSSGCRIALESSFSPSRFWEQVRQTQATVTLLFPAQVQLLLRFGEQVTPGSTTMRRVISHAYDKPFCTAYGVAMSTVWACTEAGAQGTGSELDYRGDRSEGYIGPPFGGTEIEVRDPLGEILPDGQVGELFVRHPHVMLGYLADSRATDAVKSEDGWIASGDLGERNPGGTFVFHGRLKNVVKRSGENISPEQVEDVLREHPSVVDAIVFGVPDATRTEELAAIVHVRDTGIDPASLSGFVAERLAKWKAPRYVTLIDHALDRLPNGKLNKVGVRAGHALDRAWDREA